MIRIGGSCIGRFSRVIAGTTCAEVRILQNNEHKYAWTDIEFCLKNNIFCVVNIDTYLTNSRWQPTNQQLRDFTIATKNQLKSIGANKTNCRFTFDNESDEYLAENFEAYFNYVKVIHDALAGEFDLGAGNFRTARIDWYNTLGSKYSQGYYEVLDVHFQDGMDSEVSIVSIANKFKAIKDGFGIKRIAVTEGNNFYNVSTQRGHELLKYQINIAESIGCEDFCIVFVNWTTNSQEGHGNLTYCLDGVPITANWNDMLSLIQSKKPKGIIDMIELNYVIKGSVNKETTTVQEILLDSGYTVTVTGKCDTPTVEAIKEFQNDYNLKVDGWVGSKTWDKLLWKCATGAQRFAQLMTRTAKYK